MFLDYFTFKIEQIICPKCQWTGLGSELSYGDYHEDFIVDMDCPKCHEMIGYWQSPLNTELEKWEKENPNTKTGWEELDK